MGLEEAVDLLVAVASGTGRTTTRGEAAALILGVDGGLDAFASSTELAEAVKRSPQRGPQLLKELQEQWSANPEAAGLLDGLVGTVTRLLAESGGVVSIDALTTEVEGSLPRAASAPTDGAARARAQRQAAGLLRVALDRLAEHEQQSGQAQVQRRRFGRRLALLATDQALLDAAVAAGQRADELVEGEGAVVAPQTAAQLLRAHFTAAYRQSAATDTDGAAGAGVRAPAIDDSRLVRLAADASRTAAVSGRGELHSRTLDPAEAITVALGGLAPTTELRPGELLARVAARFPALPRLATGQVLDDLVARSGVGLYRDGEVFRFDYAPPTSDTSLHTRVESLLGTAPAQPAELPRIDAGARDRARLLETSLRENGFLAIGVGVLRDRPGAHAEAARVLAETYGAETFDITGEMIAAMHRFARARKIDWQTVRSADRPDAAAPDARNLTALVGQIMPELEDRLRTAVFTDGGSEAPLVLIEPSPLARYDHLRILAELSDLAAPRRRPVWLVLPQVHGRRGPLVDGVPIQLGSPGGQFIDWGPEDTRALMAETAPAT